jgi:uncharacterized protein DUF4232
MITVRKLGGIAMALLAMTTAACTNSSSPRPTTTRAGVGNTNIGTPTTTTVVTRQVVPWLDEPASSSLLSSLLPKALPPIPLPTGAPPCTVTELSAAVGGPTEVSGDDGAFIALRNTGSDACTLTGTPRVVASAPGYVTVVAGREPMPSDDETADTAPGGTAVVRVDVPIYCKANPTGAMGRALPYHSLVISIPGGGAKKVGGLRLSFPCGMSTTPFYTPKPGPTYPPDLLATLVPRLRLPATVRPGTVLDYEVDLFNPGDRPVALSPCPAYLEHSDVPTKLLYRLDCRSVHFIPAHGEVSYEMEMAIPADASTGPMGLWWTFFGPSTRTAHGQVVVR